MTIDRELTIPVIDLGDPRATTRIAQACEETGFLVVTDHDVDPTVLDDAWVRATDFFDLAVADKMAVAMPYPGYPYGYAPMKGERLAASLGAETPPDLKETFSMGPIDVPAHLADRETADPAEVFVYEPTPWPSALPEFRPAMEAYYTAMAGFVARIMALFAEALELPSGFFDSRIDRHTSALRVLDYPAVTEPPRPGQLRAGAHTDYGTVTVLRADAAPGGLEVLVADRWTAVPLVPDSLIINLGDAMARWTNDRWRSTLHRVVTPPAEVGPRSRRQSMAFFHNANWDAVIECIPSCLAAGDSPRYLPVTAGEHLMSKFRSTQY
ncbi:MAG: isopenicillin N synthase family dioxygenase [Ilumatobacteraceae bacterium]